VVARRQPVEVDGPDVRHEPVLLARLEPGFRVMA
jgi:hypothetical protein